MLKNCPQCSSSEILLLRYQDVQTHFGTFSTSNHIQIHCRADNCRMITELADITHRSQRDDPRFHPRGVPPLGWAERPA